MEHERLRLHSENDPNPHRLAAAMDRRSQGLDKTNAMLL